MLNSIAKYIKKVISFERCTKRFIMVVNGAYREAHRFNHKYIGVEHYLLGIAKDADSVGANVLKGLGVDIKVLCDEIDKRVVRGTEKVTEKRLPRTLQARDAVKYAIEESHALNHKHVGTEHLLLGLLRVSDGLAAQVLNNLGVKLENAREKLTDLLSKGKVIIANRGKQKAGTIIKMLPFVSLASGIYPLVLIMLYRWPMENRHPDAFGFLLDIAFIIFLVLIPLGFICGLYYLIKVKTGHFGMKICAMLGTALSGFWICMFFVMLNSLETIHHVG